MFVADHGYGRSQKFHRLPRYLYALMFPNKRLYIGQSVDPKRRFQQHKSQGKWLTNNDFVMVVLSCQFTTEEEASDWEHAYRQVAAWWGWGVYWKEPGLIIRHVGLQINGARRRMAWKLWWSFHRQLRHGKRFVDKSTGPTPLERVIDQRR